MVLSCSNEFIKLLVSRCSDEFIKSSRLRLLDKFYKVVRIHSFVGDVKIFKNQSFVINLTKLYDPKNLQISWILKLSRPDKIYKTPDIVNVEIDKNSKDLKVLTLESVEMFDRNFYKNL